MLQKIIKAGNSLAVTIPSKFVKSVGVKLGQEVNVSVHIESGRVTYLFKGAHQLSLTEEMKKQAEDKPAI